MNNPIKLTATLKEISYTPQLLKTLNSYTLSNLINNELASKPSFKLSIDEDIYGFSQWVSPKRTRSYPFARVYSTLGIKNRITLIPFCKDEGKDGDRDFLQWDTVSLMSLLNIHVIIGCYVIAEKNNRPEQIDKNKITKQIYDYKHVAQQIAELHKYQSSALHWNIKCMEQLHETAEFTRAYYKKISDKTGVLMHSEKGLNNRIKILNRDVNEFREFSRERAGEAQNRENLTTQPKERIIGHKVSITMQNLLGGHYFMTADEGIRSGNKFFLIEKKNTDTKPLPSMDDVLDSFIKMTLFVNIDELKLNNEVLIPQAMVGLSATSINGFMHSNMIDNDIKAFICNNRFTDKNKETLWVAIQEARTNKFGVFVVNSEEVDKQAEIIKAFI